MKKNSVELSEMMFEAQSTIAELNEMKQALKTVNSATVNTGAVQAQSSTSEMDVESIQITYYGSPRTDLTLKVRERLPLEVVTSPTGYESETVWGMSSDAENHISLIKDAQSPGKCIIVGNAKTTDYVTIAATVAGIRTVCRIRVSE